MVDFCFLGPIHKQKHSNTRFTMKEHVNVVCIGHVDSGKSTIAGQILLQTGVVEEAVIAKYKREAMEKNRDSWYLAYILDTNEEERQKGKTVEVGRGRFNSDIKRYTVLDAPGHRGYVPNMIQGATQADVAILVVSARRGEFETGFERGGQTGEHVILARTSGVSHLIIAVNKMDDETVMWCHTRYHHIAKAIHTFACKHGFKPSEVFVVPVSGINGANIVHPVSPETCTWWAEESGDTLLSLLDKLPPIQREPDGPLRIPISATFKDMGTVCTIGKVETGTCRFNDTIIIMPTGATTTVCGLEIDGRPVAQAEAGENVVVKLTDIEEEELKTGFVMSKPDEPAKRCLSFECQLQIIDTLPHIPVISAGYRAVLHAHTLQTECEVHDLLSKMEGKTHKASRHKPAFVRTGDICYAIITVTASVSLDPFSENRKTGRFALRSEGRTIAIGRVTRVSDIV